MSAKQGEIKVGDYVWYSHEYREVSDVSKDGRLVKLDDPLSGDDPEWIGVSHVTLLTEDELDEYVFEEYSDFEDYDS